jgi:hypothetical protein
LCTATLQRPFSVGSVGEKIFYGGEQKRTEPAFLPIRAGVNFMFEQVSEKALCEILRIFHGVPVAAHETVKRRPIGLANSASAASAISGSVWLSPAATTTLQCVEGKKSLWPIPFRAWVFTSAVCITTAEDKHAREKSYDSVQRALRNPFVQGKAHHHAQPLKPTRRYNMNKNNMKKPIKEAIAS